MPWPLHKRLAEDGAKAPSQGEHWWPTDVSESQQDKKQTMNIISANVYSMASRVEEIAQWDADLVAVQETKMAAHAIKDACGVAKANHWKMIHGKPCPLAEGGGPTQEKQNQREDRGEQRGHRYFHQAPQKACGKGLERRRKAAMGDREMAKS